MPRCFSCTDETCQIMGDVREDEISSENRSEKSPLLEGLGEALEDEIEEAADGCPVEVIKFE